MLKATDRGTDVKLQLNLQRLFAVVTKILL